MQAVADRLAELPELAGRVAGAARLEALRAGNLLGQVGLNAFVIPMGMRGGAADAATGLFRQGLERVVGVVLVQRNAGDATGQRGVETIEPLIEAVVGHIAGWAPDTMFGVFRLLRGELVAMLQGGTLIYQLDFAVEDQLRITT